MLSGRQRAKRSFRVPAAAFIQRGGGRPLRAANDMSLVGRLATVHSRTPEDVGIAGCLPAVNL